MVTVQVKKVAVAGPNGTLGPSVIQHLTKADFDITLLTRNPKKASKTFPTPVKAVLANYNSVDQLAAVLREGKFDALVILINRIEVDAQIKVIDAAVAASVPHIIPSCFGIDTRPRQVRSQPMVKEKVAMEEHLVAKAQEGNFTYTAINTGMFFDWALGRGFLIDVRTEGRGPTMVFDKGKTALSVSTLDFIGEAVAQALLKRDEVLNRFLYVHSAAVTQKQLLEYVRELAPDLKIETVALNTAKLEEQALEKLRNGEGGPEVNTTLLLRTSFGLGLGLFERTDNALLGLDTWKEEDVKTLVAKYVQRIE